MEQSPATVAEYPQIDKISCPSCGVWGESLIFHVKDCEITWDHENRRFLVIMSFNAECPYEGIEWTESKVVGQVPVIIAEKSRCSCGADLTLKDYTLRKKRGLVEFRGDYACVNCQQPQNTILKKIGKGLSSFWKKTKKIELGPKGVVYEKETSSTDGE